MNWVANEAEVYMIWIFNSGWIELGTGLVYFYRSKLEPVDSWAMPFDPESINRQVRSELGVVMGRFDPFAHSFVALKNVPWRGPIGDHNNGQSSKKFICSRAIEPATVIMHSNAAHKPLNYDRHFYMSTVPFIKKLHHFTKLSHIS